jgi:hypothetical protein
VVELFWVSGYCGVEGNEKADELARMGSDSQFCGPEPCLALPTTVAKSKIKDWVAHNFIECIHLIFSLLSKANGFDKVVNKIYGTLRQHCKILPGKVFLFFKIYLTLLQINQANYA